MAATQFGIVYDAVSLTLIRLVVPDDDAELTDGTHPLAPGEAQLLQPIAELPSPLTPSSLTVLAEIVAAAQ